MLGLYNTPNSKTITIMLQEVYCWTGADKIQRLHKETENDKKWRNPLYCTGSYPPSVYINNATQSLVLTHIHRTINEMAVDPVIWRGTMGQYGGRTVIVELVIAVATAT